MDEQEVEGCQEPVINDVWPLIIIRSRYGGTYEGGDWIACTETPSSLPQSIYGGDVACASFFSFLEDSGYRLLRDNWPFRVAYGVGNTPEEAVKHLKQNMEKY